MGGYKAVSGYDVHCSWCNAVIVIMDQGSDRNDPRCEELYSYGWVTGVHKTIPTKIVAFCSRKCRHDMFQKAEPHHRRHIDCKDIA